MYLVQISQENVEGATQHTFPAALAIKCKKRKVN
jgi:hypothetical protein